MKDHGYSYVENVLIKEREFNSGGRVGEENIRLNTTDIEQIGNAKLTYVKKDL